MENGKPKIGYAVVMSRNLSSLYYPDIWQNCYAIFPTKKKAKFWLENAVYNGEGKIIKVLITEYKND